MQCNAMQWSTSVPGATYIIGFSMRQDEACGSVSQADTAQVVLDHGRAAKVQQVLGILAHELLDLGRWLVRVEDDHDASGELVVGVGDLAHEGLQSVVGDVADHDHVARVDG